MRPSIDETMLLAALVQAARGTCLKMQVGCVLTDARGNILATGYNGVARGQPHCNHDTRTDGPSYTERDVSFYPHACAGAGAPPGSDLCEAVHCEQNALTRCAQPDAVAAAYVTCSPCMRCVKQLLNTGCGRIVFLEEYVREPQARALWERAGRAWCRADDAVQQIADKIARLLRIRLRQSVSPGQAPPGKGRGS